MKYFVIILMSLTLAGCIEDGSDITNSKSVIAVCIDNVEYWVIYPESTSQSMAPRIDPKTLSFVRCKAKE
jgi:hypothetical protein